jgi:hypothetical protein
MTGASEKILLCRLYEKTGARSGRWYLYGYLGSARLVAFLDEDAELRYGATAVFNVFVQAAEERKSHGDTGGGDRPPREPQPAQQPPLTLSSGPGAVRPACPNVQRYYPPQPAEQPSSALRPWDAEISDIGRGK